MKEFVKQLFSYSMLITIIGWWILISSIHLFGRTDIYTWQYFTQLLMLMVGVFIISNSDRLAP